MKINILKIIYSFLCKLYQFLVKLLLNRNISVLNNDKNKKDSQLIDLPENPDNKKDSQLIDLPDDPNSKKNNL